jgi:hypothetical protein
MAKVQGKTAAAGARKKTAGKRADPRPSRSKGAAKRLAKKRPPTARKKPAKPPRPAIRGIAPRKPALKPAVKAVPKIAAVPHRPAAKAAPPIVPIHKPATDKKRTRRSRPRVASTGVAVATWFIQGERPRPSSFIPAPPRAEAPSLVAAPPASSDRLVSSEELTEFAVRTVPVRVDIEAGGGRVFLAINPDEVVLRVGEGIEWDFRYLAGADVTIDEVVIEFDKPSPFPQSMFRSRRPGTHRPHRQLSGPANKNSTGKQIRYAIRAINAFKAEMAVARPWVTVTKI